MRGSSILENNIVQTIASAAGTLAGDHLRAAGLIMIGGGRASYWTTVAVCAIGGNPGGDVLGAVRRALVTGSDLPDPEGVCGGGSAQGWFRLDRRVEENAKGLAAIVPAIASAVRIAGAMKLVAGEMATAFRLGGGAATGASPACPWALIGVGHLVG